MKKFFLRIHFRRVLSFLLLATLFTIPFVVVESRYVWKEELNITLKVRYQEQELTNDSKTFSVVNCILDGKGIQIEDTDVLGQWILFPEKGYNLPEIMTVKIGEKEYNVYTNGQNNIDGLSFYPENGILMINDTLLADSQGIITVIASGVLNSDHNISSDNPVEDTIMSEKIELEEFVVFVE